MKKLAMILALVGLLSCPVLAGSPSREPSSAGSGELRQKLVELKQQKARAMATHVLEAELMKEVWRGSRPPANRADTRLASHN